MVYGSEDVYFLYQAEEQDRHLREAMDGHAKAISGHINWHVIEESGILHQEPILFSMVRRPQDQVISHFMHKRRGHHWHNRERLKADFRDFLSTPWSQNWQAAFLSGLHKSNYLDPNPEELQEMAMENVRKLDFCAATDQLGKAVNLLRHELGWKRHAIEDKNVTSKNHMVEVLHEEFDKRLREVNRADRAVYRYCKGRMAKAWDGLPLWKKVF